MGSQNCRIVGKSQSVLILINPIICTRTRMPCSQTPRPGELDPKRLAAAWDSHSPETPDGGGPRPAGSKLVPTMCE
jgi:hypothetical protein